MNTPRTFTTADIDAFSDAANRRFNPQTPIADEAGYGGFPDDVTHDPRGYYGHMPNVNDPSFQQEVRAIGEETQEILRRFGYIGQSNIDVPA